MFYSQGQRTDGRDEMASYRVLIRQFRNLVHVQKVNSSLNSKVLEYSST